MNGRRNGAAKPKPTRLPFSGVDQCGKKGVRGLVVITLLHSQVGDIDVDRLNVWANEFGLSHPVIDDQGYALSDLLWPGDAGRPKSVLIGPGAQIIKFSPTAADVEADAAE